jgi:hypothetical protein
MGIAFAALLKLLLRNTEILFTHAIAIAAAG